MNITKLERSPDFMDIKLSGEQAHTQTHVLMHALKQLYREKSLMDDEERGDNEILMTEQSPCGDGRKPL